MKSILIIFIGIGLFFSSCERFLEEENLSSVTAESFYTTKNGFNSLVNANYSQLRKIYGLPASIFCAGTDLYADGRDPGPIGLTDYKELNPSSPQIDSLYRDCYKAIQLANMGLYYSDNTETTNDLSELKGELLFMRAHAYFLLVQTYGDLGIVTDYINSPTLEFERRPASEVYELIINDLNAAEDIVSTGAFIGRVNQRAVRNLLGQVHLTRGYESFGSTSDFSTAASLFDQVIMGQGLNLSFEELWTPGNEMNEEVIFSVQFSAESQSSDPQNLGHSQNTWFGPYMGGSENNGMAPRRNYFLNVTQFGIDLFEQNDTRWDATFMGEIYTRYYDYYDVPAEEHSDLTVAWFYEPKWFTQADRDAYKQAHPEIASDAFAYREYGTYCATTTGEPNALLLDFHTIPVKKFDVPNLPNVTGSFNSSTRDIIIARLGDTYLLAAEAYLQAGNTGTATAMLNVVRNRAGTGDFTGTLDIDEILDERGRECMGEYKRWFDLKRTGKLIERASLYNSQIEESNFVEEGGNLKILRPIPQEAIDLNQNKNFPQNPAYN